MKTIRIRLEAATNHTSQAEKLKAFPRLERSRSRISEKLDIAKEREAAINEKYGSID